MVNKLFLVAGRVRTSYYGIPQIQSPDVVTETRIVRAQDSKQAETKFKKHFENKCREYEVNYFVDRTEVHEEIE